MRVAALPERLRVRLAYKLARAMISRRQRDIGSNPVATDWNAYYAWRHDELRAQFTDNFGLESVGGKDVLDFGCGDGALSMLLAYAGAKSVHGVELDARSLAQFARRLEGHQSQPRPTFSRSISTRRVDLPSASFDAIFCLDVLEHIIEYRAIINEWHRLLRPSGSVYISWQPYWHPYGHHAYDWLPIPWVHLFLNEEEINEVCSMVVEWPEFKPSVWDRNPDGTRKNRFRGAACGHFLNELTTRVFERTCREAGFVFERRVFKPFSMPQPAKAISVLMTSLPGVRDFFTSYASYELRRA